MMRTSLQRIPRGTASHNVQRSIRSSVLGLVLGLALVACQSPGPTDAPSQASVKQLVKLRIEGQQAFSTEELSAVARGELFLFRRERPSKASVDDAAYALRLYYQDHGYPLARVEYELDAEQTALSLESQSGPLGVRFVIEEGPLILLKELELLGDPSVDPKELRSFFGLQNKETPYVASQVQAALRRLKSYYLELGFRDAKLLLMEPSLDPEQGSASLRLEIQEGVLYRLAKVEIEGVPAEELAMQQLSAELIGRPYTPRLGFRLRSKIMDGLANRGYARCEVTWEKNLDPLTGDVVLRYQVEKGEQVYLSEIVIEGNEHTRGRTIRSRMPLEEGDLYDASKVQSGLRRLYASGLFESIRLELDDQNRLLIHLIENPSLELRLEPGWGSYEGPRLNVVLNELNFLGTARRVSLATHASPLAAGSRFSFYEPRVFGSETDATFSLFAEQREEPSFSFENVGFDSVLSRRLTRQLSASLGYEFRLNELTDVDVQVLDPDELEEPNVGQLSLSLAYDDRDDLLLPTQGKRARVQFEFAERSLGSEIDFLRSSIDWSYIWDLGPDDGLVFNTRGVLVYTLDGLTALPLGERVFLGGENSVRSFTEDDLGPKDASGQARGGEGSTFLSTEWRHRLAGNFSSALFFDAGNVVENVEDYLHLDDFRFAVGVGLRYSLPIGPLRIDLGYNPAAREQEDDFALHFSVGHAY